jgi:hypothetical protein
MSRWKGTKNISCAIAVLLALRAAFVCGQITVTSSRYVLTTDLDPETAVEMTLRLEDLRQTLDQWTENSPGEVTGQAEVFVFRDSAAYVGAGGDPAVRGQYLPDRRRIVIHARDGASIESTARLLQHEAFHHVAHLAIRTELPPWLLEGLAEYFAEGLWVGDGGAVVLGFVSPHRLEWIREQMAADQLLPLDRLMALGQEAWNRRAIESSNSPESRSMYPQAYAIVHFLLHGGWDEGEKLLRQCVSGRLPREVMSRLWSELRPELERRFREYWSKATPEALSAGAIEAVARQLALARGWMDAAEESWSALEAEARSWLEQTGRPFDGAGVLLYRLQGTPPITLEQHRMPKGIWSTCSIQAMALVDSGGRIELTPEAIVCTRGEARFAAPIPGPGVVRAIAGRWLELSPVVLDGRSNH